MDESRLRQSMCQGLQQLWMRGLMAGDSGQVSAELHRRRYLTVPSRRRRIDLTPAGLICVDLHGETVEGEGRVDPDAWKPHKLAYLGGQVGSAGAPADSTRPLKATVLASPPRLTALLRLLPDESELRFADSPTVSVMDLSDEPAFQEALTRMPVVAIRGHGVFAAGADLADALNGLELAEHAATVELVENAMRG